MDLDDELRRLCPSRPSRPTSTTEFELTSMEDLVTGVALVLAGSACR